MENVRLGNTIQLPGKSLGLLFRKFSLEIAGRTAAFKPIEFPPTHIVKKQ
jgi:hypothetical protein